MPPTACSAAARSGRPPGCAPWSATWASNAARRVGGHRGQLVQRPAVEQLFEPARSVGAALGLLAAGDLGRDLASNALQRDRQVVVLDARAREQSAEILLGVAQRLLGRA